MVGAVATIAYLDTVMRVDSKQAGAQVDRINAKYDRNAKIARKARAANDSLSGGFSRAANSAAILEGPLGGVAGRLSSISAGFKSVGVAGVLAGAAIAGSAVVIGKGLAVLIETERQMLRSDALLNSTGFASGQTAQQLDEMARGVALSTLASTQGIRDAQAVLLTFKSVSGDTFNQTISLAQDMASVMGSDAKSAVLQLGKALEDPTKGLNALTRSGVSFTASEKEKIKALAESGRLLDAQGMLLDKIAGQFGGAAQREAESLAGSLDTLGQSLDEFAESAAKVTDSGGIAKWLADTSAQSLQNMKEFIDPAPVREYNALLVDQAGLMARLQSMGSRDSLPDINPFGESKNSWANVQRELGEVGARLTELRAKEDARIEGMKKAQEAAEKQRAETKKQAADEKRIADEKERALKAQKESLKLSKSRSSKSGSLYSKLFAQDKKSPKEYKQNRAFEADAKAAMRLISQGFTDSAKKFIGGATGTYTASKKAGDLYDLQGMKDVIMRLRDAAGLDYRDVDVAAARKKSSSLAGDGSSYAKVEFLETDRKSIELFAKSAEDLSKKVGDYLGYQDGALKAANDQQKPAKKFVLEIKKAGTNEGVSITAETSDDLNGQMANFLEDVASVF